MIGLEKVLLAAGKEETFAQLKPFLSTKPAKGEYEQLAPKIGMTANAIGVAVAYPKIPTNNAGNTKDLHSFACAIAAAVVGRPTLALLAKYNKLGLILNSNRPMTIKQPK